MTIQLKHLLLILGGTLLAAGAILGLTPVKAQGVECGTVFTGASDKAQVSDMTRALIGLPGENAAGACDDALTGRRTTTLALVVPGLGMLAVGLGLTLFSPPPTTQGAPVGATRSSGTH